MATALPESALPRVVFEDRDSFIFVMTAAPAESVNWKDALLAGDVETAVAQQVGTLLGVMHRRSTVADGAIPGDLAEFADQRGFVQLRIDPYHRATAAVHPCLAEAIEAAAQAMLDDPQCLVHGDYSPKNVMVVSGDGPPRVTLLDFEVVHLGNPVFDLAFMLNHLSLKAIRTPQWAPRYGAAARAFWSGYLDETATGPAHATSLETAVVLQIAALLLARVDGKSPVEYLDQDRQKARVREISRRIFAGKLSSLVDLHTALSE